MSISDDFKKTDAAITPEDVAKLAENPSSSSLGRLYEIGMTNLHLRTQCIAGIADAALADHKHMDFALMRIPDISRQVDANNLLDSEVTKGAIDRLKGFRGLVKPKQIISALDRSITRADKWGIKHLGVTPQDDLVGYAMDAARDVSKIHALNYVVNCMWPKGSDAVRAKGFEILQSAAASSDVFEKGTAVDLLRDLAFTAATSSDPANVSKEGNFMRDITHDEAHFARPAIQALGGAGTRAATASLGTLSFALKGSPISETAVEELLKSPHAEHALAAMIEYNTTLSANPDAVGFALHKLSGLIVGKINKDHSYEPPAAVYGALDKLINPENFLALVRKSGTENMKQIAKALNAPWGRGVSSEMADALNHLTQFLERAAEASAVLNRAKARGAAQSVSAPVSAPVADPSP